ncbi:MAG: galactofuranose transport system permease protein [Acidobacteriota bacterium]|jgi:ribose/xylose/arabinose/galactoside ABC-type transport system permease subunit|nr:galactofuranose transport system permease protein [Acidobacteriota bacterium]MDT7779584.1 galactofuranose transport system permease protein [Acidobacteriota bacterium]
MSNAAQAGGAGSVKRAGRIADYAPTYGALAALVLLLVVNSIFTPNFFDVNNFRNILLQVSPTVLVATGMTLVISTGGIDLSVGSLMAIASAVAATTLDMGAGVAVLLALAAATATGAFNGALISLFRIQPIIVTLALLISGRGVAQVLSNGGQLIPFSNVRFEYLGKGVLAGVPVQVIVMALAVGFAVFLMRATSFGRYVVAVGGNEAAARLAGVRVHRTKIAVYALSGLLAGLAGLIETARLGASDAQKVGLNIELDAIAATVVGGTPLTGGRATVLGTLIGALIMQVITTGFVMNGISYAWSLVIKAAIIIVAVYIQRPKLA